MVVPSITQNTLSKRAAKATVATWVLSPISARKNSTKVAPNTPYFCHLLILSVSSSSSSGTSIHRAIAIRSEEHTSELQSRENLVCRLLLEKKKYEPKM